MCGIGGILRIVRPGDSDYPPDAEDPRRAPGGAWLWRGREPRDRSYAPLGPTTDPRRPAQWLIPESWLDALDEHIKWRGPDGAGRFRDRVIRPDGSIIEVALVHRRLAIIDLECGEQPMVVHECPRCAQPSRDRQGAHHNALEPGALPHGRGSGALSAVVLNGCLYNHRELRAELEAGGHVFGTHHSDTEVVLHGWKEWDDELFTRLDGMYALILWDHAQQRLFAKRDPFGEKPLAFAGDLDGDDCVIASSVPALRAVGNAAGRETALSKPGLAPWIIGGFHRARVPDRNTLQFQPGGRMDRRFAEDEPRPAATPSPAPPRRSLTLDELDRLLEVGVRSRLDADVPLGCFLSGGVDSSLVAHYARKHASDLTTLTVRMPDERYDESRFARAVAARLGTRHITLDCDADHAAEDFVHIITTLGLPFGDSSILPAFWLCRAAREHVKVALAGDGGDEMFFGYSRYKAMACLNWRRFLLRLLPASRLVRSDPQSDEDRLARLIIAARNLGYPDLLAIFPTPDRTRLLPDDAECFDLRPIFGSAEDARRHDLDHYLPGDLLRKVDTASMLCGVEVRCPYLARTVADAALPTPARIHMKRGETKHLLKALARRHLPREVVHRPKQGFAVPISDWWRTNFGGLRDLLMDMLAGDRPFGRVHDVLDINLAFIRRMLDEHWAAGGLTPMHTTRTVRPRDHGQRLFALVSLAIWSRSIHRAAAVN